MANTASIITNACIAHNTQLAGNSSTIGAGTFLGTYMFYKDSTKYNIELDSTDTFTNTYIRVDPDNTQSGQLYAKVDIPIGQANKAFKIKFTNAGTDENVIELYIWKSTSNPEIWLKNINPTISTTGNELAYIQSDTICATPTVTPTDFKINTRGSVTGGTDYSNNVIAVNTAFTGYKIATITVTDPSATKGVITYQFGYETPEIKKRMATKNVCYEITKTWDLKSETLTVPTGCTLSFTHLGKINNGTIKFQGTALVLPTNKLSDIGSVTIDASSTYAIGQMVYDTVSGKPKWWNGSKWTLSDGTNA